MRHAAKYLVAFVLFLMGIGKMVLSFLFYAREEGALIRFLLPSYAALGVCMIVVSAGIVVTGMAMWFLKSSLGASGLTWAAIIHDLAMLALTLLLAGCAGHSVLPLSQPVTAGLATLFALTAHVEDWPVARGGSRSIAAALASASSTTPADASSRPASPRPRR